MTTSIRFRIPLRAHTISRRMVDCQRGESAAGRMFAKILHILWTENTRKKVEHMVKIKPLVISLAISLGVGGLSALLT